MRKAKKNIQPKDEEPEVFFDIFVSAVQMSKAYPGMFEVPTSAQLDALVYGDHVKICNGFNERFWVMVCVRNRSEKVIIGEVCSKLLNKRDYDLGDLIVFHEDHVFATLSKAEVEESIKHTSTLSDAELIGPVCAYQNKAYETLDERLKKVKK